MSLKCDILVSNFAFQMQLQCVVPLQHGTLRHYRWGDFTAAGATQEWKDGKPKFTGGAYTRVRSFTGAGGGPAHAGGVAALSISADERFVYSAGAADGAVKQWSAETGEMLTAIPRAHAGGVTSMVMLPEVGLCRLNQVDP